jgi:hypothetical protein
MSEGPDRFGRRARRPRPDSAALETAAARQGPGEALPEHLREPAERSLGVPLDAVRLHRDADAGAFAQFAGARAAQWRNHIFVRPDLYAPDTGAGRDLLGHELVHVAQNAASGAGQAALSATGDASEGEARALGPQVLGAHMLGGEPGAAAPTAAPAASVNREEETSSEEDDGWGNTWDMIKTEAAQGATRTVGALYGTGEKAVELGMGLGSAALHPCDTAVNLMRFVGQKYDEGAAHGGGVSGGLITAVNEFNPLYHLMVEAYESGEARERGDHFEAGRREARAGFALLETLAIAAGGAGLASRGVAGTAEAAEAARLAEAARAAETLRVAQAGEVGEAARLAETAEAARAAEALRAAQAGEVGEAARLAETADAARAAEASQAAQAGEVGETAKAAESAGTASRAAAAAEMSPGQIVSSMERHVTAQNARVANAIQNGDRAFFRNLGMSQKQIAILMRKGGRTFAAQYGNAMERAVARAFRSDPNLSSMLLDARYARGRIFPTKPAGMKGAPLRPDFGFGSGPLEGHIVDLTTAGGRAAKMAKYHDRVLTLEYTRPVF